METSCARCQHLRLWKVLQTLPVLDLLQHRCSIEVGAKEELVRDACRHVDVFSQALILRASCILDPRCDSVEVSRGLRMILAVRVRCCLVYTVDSSVEVGDLTSLNGV